jgi:hypothetical protein
VAHTLTDGRVGRTGEQHVRPGFAGGEVRGDAQAPTLVLLEVEVPEERVGGDQTRAVVRTDLEGGLGDHR